MWSLSSLSDDSLFRQWEHWKHPSNRQDRSFKQSHSSWLDVQMMKTSVNSILLLSNCQQATCQYCTNKISIPTNQGRKHRFLLNLQLVSNRADIPCDTKVCWGRVCVRPFDCCHPKLCVATLEQMDLINTLLAISYYAAMAWVIR